MTACQYNISAWISVDKTGLVPCCWHILEEVDLVLWQLGEVVWVNGYALYACLIYNGGCHLKHVGGVTAMTTLVVARHIAVHNGATPVHCGYRIAAEWVHGKLEAFLLCVVLQEVYVLRSKHSLARYKVGEHTLPASWQGASVEDNLQSVVVGVA